MAAPKRTSPKTTVFRTLDTTTGEVYDLCHDCFSEARNADTPWAQCEPVRNPTHEPKTACGVCMREFVVIFAEGK